MIVLLNNTGGAPLNDITKAIQGIIYGKDYDLPKKSVADAVLVVIEEKGIHCFFLYYLVIHLCDNYYLLNLFHKIILQVQV